jgi:hypothetical protein
MSTRETSWSVDCEDVNQGRQADATLHRTGVPYWSCNGDSSSMSYLQEDRNDVASRNRSATPCRDQYPQIGPGLCNRPWDPLRPTNHRPSLQYPCNTTPAINMKSTTGEGESEDWIDEDAWATELYAIAITPSSQTHCVMKPGARMQGQPRSCPPLRTYNQPSSAQWLPQGSATPAPRRPRRKASSHTGTSAQGYDMSHYEAPFK